MITDNYKGQTLNERLVLSGNLKKFEKAIKNRDREELKLILKSIEIENPDVDFLIENTKLSNDSFFKRIWSKIIR